MKKIFSIIGLVAVFALFSINASYSAVNKQINANIKTKRVPVGTVITLKLLDPVSSSTAALYFAFVAAVTLRNRQRQVPMPAGGCSLQSFQTRSGFFYVAVPLCRPSNAPARPCRSPRPGSSCS